MRDDVIGERLLLRDGVSGYVGGALNILLSFITSRRQRTYEEMLRWILSVIMSIEEKTLNIVNGFVILPNTPRVAGLIANGLHCHELYHDYATRELRVVYHYHLRHYATLRKSANTLPAAQTSSRHYEH